VLLAGKSFGDLLAKDTRPIDLKDALRRSIRAIGAKGTGNSGAR